MIYDLCIYIYAPVYICIHACIYIYTYTLRCICLSMCIYTYVYMYIYIYVYRINVRPLLKGGSPSNPCDCRNGLIDNLANKLAVAPEPGATRGDVGSWIHKVLSHGQNSVYRAYIFMFIRVLIKWAAKLLWLLLVMRPILPPPYSPEPKYGPNKPRISLE